MTRALVVTIALLIAGTIGAAEPSKVRLAKRPVTSFGYLDTDKDALITRDEAKADWAVAQGFDGADANQDGKLDREEFDQLLQKG
jgi:hypothetical protein